MQIAYATLW